MTSPLAKATFKALKQWINTSDCGIKGDNGICHLITKETKRLFNEYRLLRENGEKRPKLNYPRGSNRYKYGPFDPKRDFFCKTMSPWRIDQHLDGTKHYYSSNQFGRSLLMVDIDWHKKWQKVLKEEQSRAITLLTQHFPTGFHVPSERGHHIYLKVNYYTVDEINNLITSFQRTLQNLFLSNEITLDVEIKGSVTSEKSGSLAQLPGQSHENGTGNAS